MEIKKQFVKLCEMIYVSSNGFNFPFEDIDHDDDFSEIRDSANYSILMSKMKNLLKLVNNDYSILEKDVETELWDLI